MTIVMETSFIAEGPTNIGFGTNGPNIGYGGQMVGNIIGLVCVAPQDAMPADTIPPAGVGTFSFGANFGVWGQTGERGPDLGSGFVQKAGVFGTSDVRPGVAGTSSFDTGVGGQSGDVSVVSGAAGVVGSSQNNPGVSGVSSTGSANHAICSSGRQRQSPCWRCRRLFQ